VNVAEKGTSDVADTLPGEKRLSATTAAAKPTLVRVIARSCFRPLENESGDLPGLAIDSTSVTVQVDQVREGAFVAPACLLDQPRSH
jgi:hypothetical protein